jgi:hypothetical protein
MTAKRNRAATYLRVSREEQTTENPSVSEKLPPT